MRAVKIEEGIRLLIDGWCLGCLEVCLKFAGVTTASVAKVSDLSNEISMVFLLK